MTIYDYKTAGGKNVITEYIDGLSKAERQTLGNKSIAESDHVCDH